jgi:hypothetical protein
MTAAHKESSDRLPRWGSDEHSLWLARRLTRNLAFRRRLDNFTKLGTTAHRRRAREIAAS